MFILLLTLVELIYFLFSYEKLHFCLGATVCTFKICKTSTAFHTLNIQHHLWSLRQELYLKLETQRTSGRRACSSSRTAPQSVRSVGGVYSFQSTNCIGSVGRECQNWDRLQATADSSSQTSLHYALEVYFI